MAKKECIRMDIFKIIEIGLMIGLWGISIFCMLDVFKKFKSEDSSFKQYQEPMLEHPTVFICFNPPQKNITYELDFHILSDQNVLHIGNNTNANNDTVMLEEIKTLFYQNCYGVSTISSSPLRHAYKILQVEFNNTSIATNISTTDFFITTKNNSYGIMLYKWFDGEVLTYRIKKRNAIEIVLLAEKKIFLQSKTHCSEESTYKCSANVVMNYDFKGCSRKCIPSYFLESFPFYENDKVQLCETDEEVTCFESHLIDIMAFIAANGPCPKACTRTKFNGIVSYEGQITHIKQIEDYSTLIYAIEAPASVTVHEEYLIYDLLGLVGSVGGTLGMFIGFSFINLISYTLAVIKKLFTKSNEESHRV